EWRLVPFASYHRVDFVHLACQDCPIHGVPLIGPRGYIRGIPVREPYRMAELEAFKPPMAHQLLDLFSCPCNREARPELLDDHLPQLGTEGVHAFKRSFGRLPAVGPYHLGPVAKFSGKFGGEYHYIRFL